MTSKQQTLLGLLAIAAMAVLGFYTLFLADVDLFGKSTRITAYFPEAHGLREGDAVLVAGMRVGRVREIALQPEAPVERRVVVAIDLKLTVQLREDFTLAIEETTLLGGRNIAISPGVSEARGPLLAEGLELEGTIGGNPLAALRDVAKVFEDNAANVLEITGNLAAATEDLRAGRGALGQLISDEDLAARVSTGVDDFAAAATELRSLGEKVNSGEGTLGRLVSEDELYTTAQGIVEDLRAVSARLQAGEGAVGALTSDSELSRQVTTAIGHFDSIVAKLDSGEGTFGALLNDGSVATNLSAASGDLAEMIATIKAGGGSLGKLYATSELHDALVDFGKGLDGVLTKLEDGEGTLSLLLTDRTVYDEMLTGLRLINKSLEDYREAAPAAAFLGVLGNVF